MRRTRRTSNFRPHYFGLGTGATYCDQRACMSVCLSVCRLAYLKNYTPKFSPIFLYMLHDCGRGAVLLWRAVQVVSVLWVTSCFHAMEGVGPNQWQRVCVVQFVRGQHQSDVRQRCLVKIIRWRHRRRSLSSSTASCNMNSKLLSPLNSSLFRLNIRIKMHFQSAIGSAPQCGSWQPLHLPCSEQAISKWLNVVWYSLASNYRVSPICVLRV